MRFKTVLMLLFIFVAWYAVYQMYFNFIINISFALSIATIIWGIRRIKNIGGWFKPKQKERYFFRRVHS